jgi:predicted dehydrogenase
VAVNDVDRWRMEQAQRAANTVYGERFGQTYRGVRSYTDYRELLADEAIDAVMISTPDHWHVPMGIAAARAGKAVSMEKALSICTSHSQALVAAVQEQGVAHRLDSEFRSLRNFQQAVEIVHNGLLGEVKEVVVGVPAPLNGSAVGPQPDMPVPEELDYDQWLGPAFPAPYTLKRVHHRHTLNARPGWMRIDDYCNGMITNWGAHLLDIALWGLRKEKEAPQRIAGTGAFSRGLWNTIDRLDVQYDYADGTRMRYIIDQPYVEFIGSEATLKAGYQKDLEASEPALLGFQPGPNDISYASIPSDKADFLDAIRYDQPTQEPLEVGHNVYRTCHMGLIAVQLGRPLTWDDRQERFVDDNAANALLYRPFRTTYLDQAVSDWMEGFCPWP